MLFSCWETTSYAIIQENKNDVNFVQLKAWNNSWSTIYYILHFIKSVCFKYFNTMSVWDQDIGHIVNNKADRHGDIEQNWRFIVVSLGIEVRIRIERHDDERCGGMKCGVTVRIETIKKNYVDCLTKKNHRLAVVQWWKPI